MENSETKRNQGKLHLITAAVSNSLGAIVSTFALHPFDVVKTRLQVADSSKGAVPKYNSTFNAFRAISQYEGLRGLYRGVVVTTVAAGFSWGIFRFLFDSMRSNFANSFASNTFAGLAAGGLTTLLVHPMWLIKSRVELVSHVSTHHGWTAYKGGVDCFKQIVSNEGIKSLYLGIKPALLLVPHSTIQYTMYEQCSERKFGEANLGNAAPFFWGALSKIAAVFMTYPAQVCRTHQQMQHSQFAKMSVYDTFLHIYKTSGFLGFYKGLIPHLQRSCLHSGLMFMMYEQTKKALS